MPIFVFVQSRENSGLFAFSVQVKSARILSAWTKQSIHARAEHNQNSVKYPWLKNLPSFRLSASLFNSPYSAEGKGDPFNPEVVPVQMETHFNIPANDWRSQIRVSWYRRGDLCRPPGYAPLGLTAVQIQSIFGP